MSTTDKIKAFLSEQEVEGVSAFGHYHFVRDALTLLANEIDGLRSASIYVTPQPENQDHLPPLPRTKK